MDYAALKAEIQSGPLASELAPHIASGNDQAIADRLNAQTVSRAVRAPMVSVLRHLVDQDKWLAIVDKAAESGTNAAKTAARRLLEIARIAAAIPEATIDVNAPGVQTGLNALVSVGTITAADQTAIIAFGTELAARVDILGLGRVTPTDVAIALRKT
jgi:hypothetical protein